MAKIIEFKPPLRDLREELLHKLERAPREHVEALLDAFAVLQLLHDKGIFEFIKGTLGSGEKLLQIITETLESDAVIRGVRNLVLLLKIVGAIEPDRLELIVNALSRSVVAEKREDPPGVMRLVGRLSSKDSRRALAPLVAALEVAGRNMDQLKADPRKKRQKTTRHNA